MEPPRIQEVIDGESAVRDATPEEIGAMVSIPVTPSQVTNRQAKLALLGAGKLAAVDTAIAAMPSPQKEAARVEWTYAGTFDRTSPLVLTLGPALGLDDAALDDLFTAAATL